MILLYSRSKYYTRSYQLIRVRTKRNQNKLTFIDEASTEL